MNNKLLILIIVMLPLLAIAQDDGAAAAAAMTPQQILDAARAAARDGNADAAVDHLQRLVDGGFTSVALFQNDKDLGQLAGHAGYDELISNLERVAYPCEHDEAFREFDFWVGSWDVHTANGTFAGKNEISREERGCVLVEHWQNAYGSTGSSINYVDKITGEWVQVWNDASGSQINIRGGLGEDGMRMSGTIHYVATGQTLPFRALWTPLEDGRVRQFFEASNDEGQTWTAWFEGFYSRSKDTD